MSQLDGAQLAILNSRFEGIARKMANTLLRTGRSGVLNRARDFSCCIVTAECELLTAADSLPIHVLSGPDIMARSMHGFHPELKRGDAFLHNSPYHGCSHAADHTVLVPVVDDNGVHHFTVLAKAHQADVGNAVPTTYHGAAKDVYDEGALIFPAVKVQQGYQSVDDVVRMCQMRIRVPEQWHGDFLAMIGAARIGERELLELGREYGWDCLHGFAAQWFDYSEKCMVEAIKELPSGEATCTRTHDALEGVIEHKIPVNAAVDINSETAMIQVDLTDNIDCIPCGLNVSEACTRTAAMVGIFNSINHTVPKNGGSFRRISLLLRKNCVVGIPEHPYSCSAATTNVSDRISNAVQAAIAEIADGFGMAEIGANLPASRGVFSGVDPRNGQPFVNQVFLGSSGGGGAPDADGWLHYSHAGNGGMGFLDSIELAELYQPIKVYARRLVKDTEGAGRYRGAPGKYIEFGPNNCSIHVAYVCDAVDNTPKGVCGGGDAKGNHQYLQRGNGNTEILSPCAVVNLAPEDRIQSYTCGGGGYGSPFEREPQQVLKDVLEGWITRERAGDIYGVIIDHDDCIDEQATTQQRGTN